MAAAAARDGPSRDRKLDGAAFAWLRYNVRNAAAGGAVSLRSGTAAQAKQTGLHAVVTRPARPLRLDCVSLTGVSATAAGRRPLRGKEKE